MAKKKQPILFTYISIKKGRVILEYKMGKENQYSFHTFDCPELPLPSFINSLQELKTYCLESCEQEVAEDIKERLEIRSISLDYQKDNQIMGVIIHGYLTYKKSSGGLNLLTPRKIDQYIESEIEDDRLILPEKTADFIQEVISEAEKYLNGERAQGELFEKKAS